MTRLRREWYPDTLLVGNKLTQTLWNTVWRCLKKSANKTCIRSSYPISENISKEMKSTREQETVFPSL